MYEYRDAKFYTANLIFYNNQYNVNMPSEYISNICNKKICRSMGGTCRIPNILSPIPIKTYLPNMLKILDIHARLIPNFVLSLGPSDAIWRQRSGSTVAQEMACCLTAPSHYLNQCYTDHQWSPVTFILGQFYKRCLNHQSLKSVWKLHV